MEFFEYFIFLFTFKINREIKFILKKAEMQSNLIKSYFYYFIFFSMEIKRLIHFDRAKNT
jgi:hypothetical protein